jgi:uncharacterized OB-fold protein
MALFPNTMPAPAPNFEDTGFWEACNRRELSFQCCSACGHTRHPPSPVCPACRSLASGWKPTRGQGTVYTFTIIHHASHEAVKPNLPYVVAIVEFDDVPGVRLVTNLTGASRDDITVGMRVEIWWDDLGEGQFLPRCRPAVAQAF